MMRIVALAVFALLVCMGALAVHEALVPAPVGAVKPLPPSVVTFLRDLPPRRMPSVDQLKQMSDAAKREQMEDALLMLRCVCPEVATWVEDRYKSGNLVFENHDTGHFAAFSILTRTLYVNVIAFADDETLAVVLAHEYRHSRQPLLRIVQINLAALAGLNRQDLVEDEAYEFEGRVYRALHGNR